MNAIVKDVAAGALPRDYGIFAITSLRFAVELVAHLEDGGFHNPAWVRSLALDADTRYLNAVRNVSGARPPPWQLAFDVADRGEHKAVRNLLLGINAHIMYDLVVTLAPVLDPSRRDEQHRDFMRINDIIERAVDGVQDQIEANTPPWLLEADVVSGRIDELLVWTLFKVTRAGAFDQAEKLRDGRITRRQVEKRAMQIGRALVHLPI